jgi:acyl-CoA thioesterase
MNQSASPAAIDLDGAADLVPAIAQTLMKNDAAARSLGIRLIAADLVSATLELKVSPDHLNGHGSCHGGVIFTLADTAFAIACNASNVVAVAAAASIDFISPGRAGEVMRATASRRSQGQRTGVYDIEVRGEDERLIALFRGNAARLKQQVIKS